MKKVDIVLTLIDESLKKLKVLLPITPVIEEENGRIKAIKWGDAARASGTPEGPERYYGGSDTQD